MAAPADPASASAAAGPAGGSLPALPSDWPAVLAALDEARARGFLGDGQDVEAVAEHARGFVGPIADATRVLDLGSGAGVPGLVVAALRPDAAVTLLDASVGRTDWLRRVVGRLGWEAHVPRRHRARRGAGPRRRLAGEPGRGGGSQLRPALGHGGGGVRAPRASAGDWSSASRRPSTRRDGRARCWPISVSASGGGPTGATRCSRPSPRPGGSSLDRVWCAVTRPDQRASGFT